MSSPIIVAVDPRREDPAPLALGLRLARLSGAPLLLAAVFPTHPSDRLHPDLSKALNTEAKDALARARQQLTDAPGSAPDLRLLAVGGQSPARALYETAVSESAVLVVIGSSARGTLGRASPGAVTDRFLHGAPCAVAVAPHGLSLDDANQPWRRVAVAYVDEPDGQDALQAAAAVARAAGAHLRVLVVMQAREAHVTTAPVAPVADHEPARREHADTQLLHGLQASGYADASGDVLDGDPASALAAASSNHDLLVCGSRGFGPLRTVILGGTSHALVRRAACPVLVVPRGAAEPIAAAARAGEVAAS
jgi:nucleotide-binding universal stress UspA family protein